MGLDLSKVYTEEMLLQFLQDRAPSALTSTRCLETTSEKYKTIPTIPILNLLVKNGWYPVEAKESKVDRRKMGSRTVNRRGYQKHMIKFRYAETNGSISTIQPKKFHKTDSYPELLFINSYDGTAAMKILIGLFRLVCSNGLVVMDESFENLRFRHMYIENEDVKDLTSRTLDHFDHLENNINKMINTKIEEDEIKILANSMAVDWYKIDNWKETEGYNKMVRHANALLVARRDDDYYNNDIWHKYNIIQENMIKGGMRYKIDDYSFRRMRKITSMDNQIRLNRMLWEKAYKLTCDKESGNKIELENYITISQ